MVVNFGELIATTGPNKTLFHTTKSHIESFTVNWRHNRPADAIRIRDIMKHYQDTHKTWIDHVIYTWWNGDQLHVYDGWNRYVAASSDMKLILSVFDTHSEDEIIDDFFILNKSVPIPDIYDGTVNQKIELLMTVCERFDDMYGDFKKPSRNPRCPHYNRDILLQILGDLPISYDTLTPEKMMSAIIKTNNELGKYPIKFPAKAKEHNFYMFATKTINLAEMLTKNLTEESTIGNKIMKLFR